MSKTTLLTTTQANRLLNVPLRWLQHLVFSPPQGYGLVTPAVPIRRPGQPKLGVLLGPKELREISLIRLLRQHVSMRQIREAADFLRGLGENPYSHPEAKFVVLRGRDGKLEDLMRLTDGRTALRLLRRGQGQLILPLPALWTQNRGDDDG